MSTTDHVTETEARGVAAFFVITRRGAAGARLHLPAPTASRREPAPLCAYDGHASGWRAKDTAVYPPGYRALCRRCLARYAAQHREAERLPRPEGST